MNFSTDRDLIISEPTVFDDLPLLAQQPVNVTDAAVAGTTLTSAAADFVAAQVEPGSVVLIAGVAHEVTARADAHTLTVSLLRARLSDPPIPGTQGEGLACVARTFAPQAALVHDALVALLGVDEDAIVSLSAMARLETLGTLERLYAGAGALAVGGWRNTFLLKADDYRRRFGESLRHARILVDLDGDGIAERTLQPGLIPLVRV